MTEPAPYRWANAYKLEELLSAEESDAVVDDLLDALDRVLLDPLNPALASQLRGTDRIPDEDIEVASAGYPWEMARIKAAAPGSPSTTTELPSSDVQ